MDEEDFGYVERRVAGGRELKNEYGKLESGKGSDELDQSLRTLSISVHGESSAGATKNSENEKNNNSSNNSPSQNGEKMLKHMKKASPLAKTPTISEDSDKSTMDSSNKPKSTNNNNNNNTNNNNNKDSTKENSSSASSDNQVPLPQRFVVKYLGYRETSNLWGIKYTRRPVDEMVTEAKLTLSKNTDKSLPLLKLEVTESGIVLSNMPQNNNPDFPSGKFPIEAISYGVQDLVYTRVFAMIVVKSALISEGESSPPIRLADIQKAQNAGTGNSLPFRCHAFVCDSRATARRLTYSLAAAFHKFSQHVAAGKVTLVKSPKKFAIDLRSPEEIESDLIDSEA